MTRAKKPPKNQDKVGYGNPPVHTRFQKGQSGNPSGRPHGIAAERVKALVLKEAYRMVRVKEGDTIVALPAIQAILRGQVALAARGNGPAQRAVIETIQAIERDIAAQAAARERADAESHTERDTMSPLEVARRIAFTLERGARELERQKREALLGADHTAPPRNAR